MEAFSARWLAPAALMAALGSMVPGPASAQSPRAPGLFPLPMPAPYPAYTVVQTAASRWLWDQASEPSPSNLRRVPPELERSPSDIQPSPSDVLPSPGSSANPEKSVISPDFEQALAGDAMFPKDWDSCTAGVGDTRRASCGCRGHRTFLYADALLMTRVTNRTLVTSVDSGSGDAALVFGPAEFDNLWHGGFELGGGWCFGCDGSQGLEVVYWGLYSAPAAVAASGTLDSTIDFSALDYGGGAGDDFFMAAAAQRVQFDQNFHSLEINWLGNYGGPLGCGRCGCCSPGCGSPGCGSRWGHGWLAGFRYINFTEDWLLSSDNSETVFDGDDSELNYAVDVDNNLLGFQMGLGLDYCVTHKFQAYAVAKFGVFGNFIDHRQQVSGVLGAATLNSGAAAGNDYVIDNSNFDLALAGQFDFGGRYAINRNWTLDFGYRLVGLSGVATAADNIAAAGFQNIGTIADTQTGSLILHGGYAGLTYCW